MNLAPEQFKNANPNFSKVTFNVTDGYLTILPVSVAVTIVGNSSSVAYDGEEHNVSGYTATADCDFYNVDENITFNGSASATRKDVGKTDMGLSAEQFENNSENFSEVLFTVKDGYQEVVPVYAVVTTKPASTNPTYNGSSQKLVTEGVVDGGTLYYALGSDKKNVPQTESFSTDIPEATKTGSYYVWYTVESDSNHLSPSPVCIKVVLAEEKWVTLDGVLYDSDGETPLGNATVTLMNGNTEVDREVTDADGKYHFLVPAGVYSVVVNNGEVSETTMVDLFADKEQNIKVVGSNTESVLNIDSDDDSFSVAVDGLNEEAQSIRKADNLSDDTKLSVEMTVEAKTVKTAKNAKAFDDLSKNKTFAFFDVKLEKNVNSQKTVLDSSDNVIEIAMPYEKINRRGLGVYYSDGTSVKAFTESSSKEEGTFSIDKTNGIIYIYTKSFSTFAVGYTPYYKLNSSATLGSYSGKVTVVIKGKNGEGTYTLKDVSPSEIKFSNVPKGTYEMTVTWKDGATNKLTMPLTVS